MNISKIKLMTIVVIGLLYPSNVIASHRGSQLPKTKELSYAIKSVYKHDKLQNPGGLASSGKTLFFSYNSQDSNGSTVYAYSGKQVSKVAYTKNNINAIDIVSSENTLGAIHSANSIVTHAISNSKYNPDRNMFNLDDGPMYELKNHHVKIPTSLVFNPSAYTIMHATGVSEDTKGMIVTFDPRLGKISPGIQILQSFPAGIHVDNNYQAYFSDYYNSSINRLDLRYGKVYPYYSNPSLSPTGVTKSQDNEVFFTSSTTNSVVQLYEENNKVKENLIVQGNGLHAPRWITFGPDKTLYVQDKRGVHALTKETSG